MSAAMRLLPPVFLLLARFTDAQVDTAHHIPGATVSGIVRDSIARLPLASATVQLVASDNPAGFVRTAVSDALGRYTLSDVPDGRYTLGFFHPMLDSLGIEDTRREVHVDGHQAVHADLAIPSPARLRAAFCGPQPNPTSNAVVVGVVRDARDGSPVAGVTVTGEWLEVSFGRAGVSRNTPRRATTTAANGWFAICDVPTAGTMLLTASRGADSTDLIERQIPAEGFLRSELYLGASRSVARTSGQPGDSLLPSRGKRHVGDGELHGVVLTAAEGLPIGGALVSISDGPETHANGSGEWTLSNVPSGTRMLEVRALGYYPERRYVHVIAGAPRQLVELSTIKDVLDTVRVRATRYYNRDRSGFAERRHLGVGRYLTPEDIARRPAVLTSQLFANMSGIRLGFASDTAYNDMVLSVSPDSTSTSDRRVLMRGIAGDWCAAAIYIDGLRMPGFDTDALDAWVLPKDVSGIEIYSEATVPPEFQQGRSGCGSIVIWRK